MRRLTSVLASTLLLLAVVIADWANASDAMFSDAVVQTDNVRAELVADVATASPGTSFWVALQLDIRDGWHTYWRNPGDSGEPTHLSLTFPDGITVSEIHWPFPERIPYGHLINFGYEDRVLHLARVTVPADWPVGSPLELTAEASWLVCKDICIPESGSLRVTLPVTSRSAEVGAAAAAKFEDALSRLPTRPNWPASFRVHDETLVLKVETGTSNSDIVAATFFPYEWGTVEPAGDQEFKVDGGWLILNLKRAGTFPDVLEGVVVVEERAGDGSLHRAIEINAASGSPIAPNGATAMALGGDGALATASGSGTLKALAFAFLGGLILNLMPCVFPVLSVKAIGIVKHGKGATGHLRLGGLSYTAGVLAFMALVGGVLVALKSAGAEIGWGFQLQSPAFVAIMAVVLFSLGLSLSGYFTLGASVMGWGGGLAERSDTTGSFFTGALAALVATPCTAPFMGAAIGYALAQPWAVALAGMLSLGLGLAFPYLLLTWIPGVANRLPRPGPWMEQLKQLLAFPMYAAAAWLVWVLSIQAGSRGVLTVLLAMILVGFAIWLLRATRESGRKGRAFGSAATVVVLTVAAVSLVFVPRGSPPVASTGGILAQADWPAHAEPFSVARLEELRAAGTPVFVNITAAWCITCKLNEQVALSSDRVARDFAERQIVYLKGDWTNRDAEISRYLSTYGRGGVPLYVVYKDDAQEPLVLPQILTESLVLEAVEDVPRTPTPQVLEKRS